MEKTKGLKQWRKENNILKSEMDEAWKTICATNGSAAPEVASVCKALDLDGMDWKYLTIEEAQQLIHAFRALQKDAKEQEGQLTEDAQLIKNAAEMDHTLPEDEVLRIVKGDTDAEIVEEVRGETHRWQVEMKTILKVGEEYYAIDWFKGLTEMQEDSCYHTTPYRVYPREKTILVYEASPSVLEQEAEEDYAYER